MPKLQMKGRRGYRQIRIGDGGWLAIDHYIQPAKMPVWVRSIAFYLNGPDTDVRLTVLRAIAKEQQWQISGEFVDDGAVPGPAFEKFLEYDHNLKTDAYILWMGVRPPKITPSRHKLPQEDWVKYY